MPRMSNGKEWRDKINAKLPSFEVKDKVSFIHQKHIAESWWGLSKGCLMFFEWHSNHLSIHGNYSSTYYTDNSISIIDKAIMKGIVFILTLFLLL